MTGPMRPPGLALRRANTRILAKRQGWPKGALTACWRLEKAHPGWVLSWMGENTIRGFERPACYWAKRDGIHEAEVRAATPEGVKELILLAPPAEHDYSPNEYCPYCGLSRPWRAGF